MLKYYLKALWRKLIKDKTFSFINLFGLSVGITTFLVIILYVVHEYSYDKHYKNKDRIYRLELSDGDPWMSSGDGHLLYTNIPEIEKYTRFKYWDNIVLSNGSNNANEERKVKVDYLALADSSVCDIFDFTFIEGVQDEALNKPFSIVLTKSVAKKIFGNQAAYNKIIKVGNDEKEYTVKGVIEDLHEPTHLNFQAVASFVTLEKLWAHQRDVLNNFYTSQFSTYVLLSKNHNLSDIENKMSKLALENVEDYNDYEEPVYKLNNLKNVYLNGTPLYGDRSNNGTFVLILLIIAILILVVACINYINLSTSKAIERFTEIGVKKVIGAKGRTIYFQVISESMIFNLVALLISLFMTYLLLPFFNNLLESSVQLNVILQPVYFVSCIVGVFIVGIISGLYPSLYFNKLNIVNILKGTRQKGKGKFHVRQGLTIFQFSISIALLISTIIIKKQLNFVRYQDLGFNNEQIVTFGIQDIDKESFRHELLKNPDITNVSYSNSLPGMICNWEGLHFNNIQDGVPVFSVEPGFLEMYGMKIIAGRDFDKNLASDKLQTCIINEAAARHFQLKNPIGEITDFSNSENTSFYKGNVKIIGVVKDFNYLSLHEPLGPMVFNWNSGWGFLANVKVSSNNVSETINYIKSEWEKRTDKAFTYQFASETFDKQYKADEKLGSLVNVASVLAIIISSLGIFGLTIFSIQKRIKEIGIRKVNGAKIFEILGMLNKDLVKWVVISFVIATPIAWYTMNNWLENFVYKTGLSWWIFALAGILTILIALLTVSWQTWRAARRNPVEALRYE